MDWKCNTKLSPALNLPEPILTPDEGNCGIKSFVQQSTAQWIYLGLQPACLIWILASSLTITSLLSFSKSNVKCIWFAYVATFIYFFVCFSFCFGQAVEGGMIQVKHQLLIILNTAPKLYKFYCSLDLPNCMVHIL